MDEIGVSLDATDDDRGMPGLKELREEAYDLDGTDNRDGLAESAVVRKVTRLSAEESTQKGELMPVNYRHFLEAVKEVEPSLDETN